MRRQFLQLLAVAAGLAFSSVSAWAAGEDVKFETADRVELHGTYYPSAKGKKAHTVLMLHAIDAKASSKAGAWGKLAEELQKAGCAVLTFDFRGFGDSTTVDKEFWAHPENQRYVSGFSPIRPKESILYKDFRPGYTPMLVNDVMAAKMYLDRRNDAAECNSGKLIIIGAEEGATLGLMWAAAECNRYLALPNVFPPRFETKAQGKDLAAVLGISMSPTLGSKRSIPIDKWLKQVGIDGKVPVAFIYGTKERGGLTLAKEWLRDLKVDVKANKPDPDRPYTWHVGIANTTLSGQALVSDKTNTIDTIVNYIKRFAKDENADNWEKREAEKNMYIWKFGFGAPITAKLEKQRDMNPLPLAVLGVSP